MEGCPCPACSDGHSRGYLRYLVKNKELTGVRLLTLHNLAYVARLMAGLRAAIAGRDARPTCGCAARRRGSRDDGHSDQIRGVSGRSRALRRSSPARPGGVTRDILPSLTSGCSVARR